MKKIYVFILLAILPAVLPAQKLVKEINLSAGSAFIHNSAGPVILKSDDARLRIVAANTLSSNITILHTRSGAVVNIPVSGRALQHLKSASMAISKRTGFVYLCGIKKLIVVNPDNGQAESYDTEYQFESVAVDPSSGNALLAGRECPGLGFYNYQDKEFEIIDWLESGEELKNENQTPPPPIRRIAAYPSKKMFIAIDGYEAKMYNVGAADGKILSNRELNLTKGGRWHVAGLNDGTGAIYIMTENKRRRPVEAAKIDLKGSKDIIVKMDQNFSEPAGINYNSLLDEMYVPYDNQPSVHVIDFKKDGKISEIAIPAYGNDGSVVDEQKHRLYIASWALGEIEVIDLKKRKFLHSFKNLGIIPHMFAFAINNHKLYYPVGATAVNGCFGASVTELDPMSGDINKHNTGWCPVDIIDMPSRSSVLVFNNEDEFAEIESDYKFRFHKLPWPHPIACCAGNDGDIQLSYGAHQSYWPNVYIWDSKNGILRIDDRLTFHDRRIPAQALQMIKTNDGRFFLSSNNWGRREQFISVLRGGIRKHEIGDRIRMPDTVSRETTQRIMKYDSVNNIVFLCRVGEKEGDPGILQVISADSNKVIARMETGINPTDLAFDDNKIYVANFGSDNIYVFDRNSYELSGQIEIEKPLKMTSINNTILAVSHSGYIVLDVTSEKEYDIPTEGNLENIFNWGKYALISAFTPDNLTIYSINMENNDLKPVFSSPYKYGETSFATTNSAFYMSGQYGDAILSLTRGIERADGSFWISDFLSGKVFVLEN